MQLFTQRSSRARQKLPKVTKLSLEDDDRDHNNLHFISLVIFLTSSNYSSFTLHKLKKNRPFFDTSQSFITNLIVFFFNISIQTNWKEKKKPAKMKMQNIKKLIIWKKVTEWLRLCLQDEFSLINKYTSETENVRNGDYKFMQICASV